MQEPCWMCGQEDSGGDNFSMDSSGDEWYVVFRLFLAYFVLHCDQLFYVCRHHKDCTGLLFFCKVFFIHVFTPRLLSPNVFSVAKGPSQPSRYVIHCFCASPAPHVLEQRFLSPPPMFSASKETSTSPAGTPHTVCAPVGYE